MTTRLTIPAAPIAAAGIAGSADGSVIGGSVLTLTGDLEHVQVGNGWSAWSNGYTGDVYAVEPISSIAPAVSTPVASTSATPAVSLVETIGLPAGTTAFYMYAEPFLNAAEVTDVTATASDGESTTVEQTPNGNGGADGYAFYTDAGTTLTSLADLCRPVGRRVLCSGRPSAAVDDCLKRHSLSTARRPNGRQAEFGGVRPASRF